MNARIGLYVQAIRGPVLLLTIGILFAMQQAHVISFSRTWPLLIIVIGIMKLLERMWSPSQAAWTHPSGSGPFPGGYQGPQRSEIQSYSSNKPQGPGA